MTPFSKPRVRQRWRATIAVGLAIFFAVSSTTIASVAARCILNATARAESLRLLDEIDTVIDEASSTATDMLRIAGRPCSEVVLPLRQEVESKPYVRSASLVNARGMLYCSSLIGIANEVVDPTRFVDGRLKVLPFNSVTPDSSLLILRATATNGAVLIAVDGRLLRNILTTSDLSEIALLRVGDVWLGSHGIENANSLNLGKDWAIARSLRFPIEVRVGDARQSMLWRLTFRFYPWLIVIVAVSTIVSLLFYRWASSAASGEKILASALRGGEFEPYIQPLIDTSSGNWIGGEILVRWHHRAYGTISPEQFIPLAEQCGAIVPITQMLMKDTAQKLRSVEIPLPLHISFNICARHFSEGNLYEDCKKFLRDLQHSKIRLVLELTERELIVPDASMRETLLDLRQLGVRLALDDFGTGHANFSLLDELEVDMLKIDKKFVSDVDKKMTANPILESMIDLGKILDIVIVVEGVETAEQHEYLRRKEVNILQGYYFSRPMPLQQFLTMVQRQN